MLSIVSWLALLIILAAFAAAWSKRFLATGALAVANIIIYVMTDFGPQAVIEGRSVPVIHLELGLWAGNLYSLAPMGVVQLFSSMFVHADFFHLLGNLIVLLAFALPFEERIGHRAFLVLYIGSGLVGALAQVGAYWGNPMLLMGASGAVFGIIGAFAAAYPRLVIPLPLPLMFIMIFVRMRVLVGAMIFGGLQILYLVFMSQNSNTAYMAHIGGLAGGLALSFIYLKIRGRPDEPAAPVKMEVMDFAPFAGDKGTRMALEQMKQNKDEPVIFHAWWERFWQSAKDPATGMRVTPGKPGTVIREDGKVLQLPYSASLPPN